MLVPSDPVVEPAELVELFEGVELPPSRLKNHIAPKTATKIMSSPPTNNGINLEIELFGLANSISGLVGTFAGGGGDAAPAPAGSLLAETDESAVTVCGGRATAGFAAMPDAEAVGSERGRMIGDGVTGLVVVVVVVAIVGSCEITGGGTGIFSTAGMGGVINNFPGTVMVELEATACGTPKGGVKLALVALGARAGVLGSAVVFAAIGERTAVTGGIVVGGVVVGNLVTGGGGNPGADTTPTPPAEAGGKVTELGNTGVLRLAGGTGLGSGRFAIAM